MDRNGSYVNGVTINNWSILDLANLRKEEFQEVVGSFVKIGRENGVQMNSKVYPSPTKIQLRSPRDMDDALGRIEADLTNLKRSNATLELLLIVLPFKAGILYDRIKHLGDMKLNMTTQCCLRDVLFRQGKVNFQVVSNICLKINSKLGGLNHVLPRNCRPKVFERPVMIMGADVSHPAPESRGIKPSIAAIVGSVEPK